MTDWKWMTGFGTEGNRENGECRHRPSIRLHPNPPRQQGPPPRRLEVKESLSIGLESGMDMDMDRMTGSTG